MSKYTTEVRFICETEAGLTESVGETDVNSILDSVWNKIFTTDVEFFDPNHKSVVCKKILKRYYTREIGAETVGLWKLWMNERLESIMPKYNPLYESASVNFDWKNDVDYTRTGEREDTNTGTITDAGKTGRNGSNTRRYSDTPQGGLDGIEADRYLTEAEIQGYSESGTSGNTRTNNLKGNGEYTERVYGKMGTLSYSKMLEEYRKTIINIDEMIVQEFSDLFFGLW